MLAALVAIGMNINFFLDGSGDMWFFMVSIAMLVGPGHAFGLDHYLMPRIWRYLKRVL